MPSGDAAAALATVVAGVLLPGAAVLHWARLETSGLLRWALALAFGRVLLALAALAAATLGAFAWLPAWCVLWALVWLGVGLRSLWRGAGARARRPRLRTGAVVGGLLVAAAALWLVMGVAGRGRVVPGGELVFHGHHTTNDPLTYAGVTRQLSQHGLPIRHPYAAGLPNLGHALFFGEIAGLQGAGRLDLLDVLFRVRPLLDVGALALGTAALVRVLGGSTLAATLGALLLLLGGGLSQLSYLGFALAGRASQQIELWSLGTPFLLPVNPIAPGLQTAFAALALLAGLRGDAAVDRRRALAAGVLLGAVLELKLFLWPVLTAGLAATALLRPPAGIARPLRWATGASLLVALPALLEKAMIVRRIEGLADVGVVPCLGCLPRFALDWSFGSLTPDSAIFESFRPGDLLDPGLWGVALAATAAWAVIGLGARLFALPALTRGCREDGAPGRAAVHRIAAWSAALGLALVGLVHVPPHFPNAGQFGWTAQLGLWPFLGLALGRWLAARRLVRAVLVVLLALPSGLFWVLDQGWWAPPFLSVTQDERILLSELSRASRPGDVVLEPSLAIHESYLSPVAWQAGRAVVLSHGGAAAYLTPEERARREGWIRAAFRGEPAESAAAIRESGADFVYAPSGLRPRAGAEVLELLRDNAAGAVYRVRGTQAP